MDCTFIKYIDGQKEIKYGIDTVLDTRKVETYLYSSVTTEEIEEIKKCTTDNLQSLLDKFI